MKGDWDSINLFNLYGRSKPGAKQTTYKKYIASLITETPDDLTVKKIEEYAKDIVKWMKLVTDCVYPIE
jgi:hypothetical protein